MERFGMKIGGRGIGGKGRKEAGWKWEGRVRGVERGLEGTGSWKGKGQERSGGGREMSRTWTEGATEGKECGRGMGRG